MLPFPPKVLRRILLAAGLLAAGAAFAAAYGSGLLPWPGKESPARDTEVAKQDTKIKITATTDFTQKITYLKCGDEETFHSKPADNLVGLTAAQVQKVYTGWTMDKFDTQEAVLSLKIDSYCREHANNTFIGVKDGYVAVYSGRPGPRAIVKEITRIPVQQLTIEDIEELKRGMVVKSREELLRTLEGMQAQ
ncbi:MAG: BofC C-terminal domain-containing protein [Sporomusaceae bacterium]|nr:BofC C-terminal domain-containing protein [Sporomusaceae bacterium]